VTDARQPPALGRRPTWREVAAMPGRRLFVAVPLSEAARSRVTELVESLRASQAGPGRKPDAGADRPSGRDPRRRDVRWVRLDGLHLTLRFLGPTDEARVPVVAQAVAQVAARTEPFAFTIHGGGAFPDASRPRALWLGVTDGSDALAAIAGALDRELAAGGWPLPDRPFRAHLTLARSDGVAAGAEVARRLADAARGLELQSEVDRLVLFESITGGGPARYVRLAEGRIGADPGTPGRVPSDLTGSDRTQTGRSQGDPPTS
jgi:2'-5' RNA ligase